MLTAGIILAGGGLIASLSFYKEVTWFMNYIIGPAISISILLLGVYFILVNFGLITPV